MMNILQDFYGNKVLSETHVFSPSGVYHQLSPEADHGTYMAYIKSLPINDPTEIFGLHDNANITFAQNETFTILGDLVSMQPKTSSSTGKSREEVMEDTARGILEKVPPPVPVGPVMEKYPVMYEESMNTVVVQEVIRYNRLLNTVRQTLNDLLKALKGLVVMSGELEGMANSLYINQVPTMWAGKAYPSLKPLASWVVDLVTRMEFIHEWIDHGIPTIFWISGFFFPQAFLTGTLQNYARSQVISIDTITFDFQVMRESISELKERPEHGVYIRGLFLEGARWDSVGFQLAESNPKELYTDMPVMWLKPMPNRKAPTSGIYLCPVYKTLQRAENKHQRIQKVVTWKNKNQDQKVATWKNKNRRTKPGF
ncbi:PREDICTED: dynein heavy chain 1, axonemal-like [Branchiostoma belcheri]|uniref:Dynein heavy chain 1, axonemal-like n=1 Tax=Branchiostoma belcheri TaxID=7741 RepID=A0A6P4YEW7_BRABE|nr:PREDICTED: dynein heavy chain 1, axonemal-like [Branchiostoma belcheri]